MPEMGLNATATVAPATDIAVSAALSLDVQHWNRRPASGEEAPAQNLSAEDKVEAEKRLVTIEAMVFPGRFPKLWQECGGRKLAVVQALAAQYGRPARTIRHWVTQYRRNGMLGLVNRDRSDKGVPHKANKAAKELILGLAIPKRGVFGALSGSEMHRAYEEERGWRDERIGQVLREADAEKYKFYLDEDGRLSERARLPVICSKTLRAYVNLIPEAARTMARGGEEAFRNTQEIISYRALSEVDPLEWVVGDHRLLDVFTRVPVRGGWRVVRPWISAFLDMRSRRFLAWGIFEVPSSDAIASILKRLLIEHGVPHNILIDNGKDYRSEFLEGPHVRRKQTEPVGEFDPTWRGVFGTLGIRVTHSIVRNPRSKIIEANFTRLAAFDKQLPEYVGHRPSERPEAIDGMVKQHEAWLRGERPESPFRTIQEMATLYDAAIADLNERPLQGEGMQTATPTGRGWMSPSQCWDKLIQRVERRTVRTEDLRVVFTKRRLLTVRHGEIAASFGGQKFHYRLEAEPTQLMALNGQLVEIALDPHDLGQAAVYWRDAFVGLAVCAPLRKQGEDLFVEDERLRRAARREIKRAIATVHQRIPVASPEERLARRREVLPERMTGVIGTPVELPAPIAEAAAAVRAASEFRFADAGVEVECVKRPADDDVDDGSFSFFSDGRLNEA
jgi:hypothetical protein